MAKYVKAIVILTPAARTQMRKAKHNVTKPLTVRLVAKSWRDTPPTRGLQVTGVIRTWKDTN